MQELTFSGLMEGVLVLQAPEDLEQDPEELELQPGQGLHHPSKPRSRVSFKLKKQLICLLFGEELSLHVIN